MAASFAGLRFCHNGDRQCAGLLARRDGEPSLERCSTSISPNLENLAGGLLIITTPFNHSEYCQDVYKRPDALYGQDLPYICRSHSAKEIEEWQGLGARLKRRELWRLFSGPVWATGNRIAWEQAQSEADPHQLGCFEFEKI